ncbi:MAG: hypothetical protein ACFB16_03475 [Phormidesmis sp.]
MSSPPSRRNTHRNNLPAKSDSVAALSSRQYSNNNEPLTFSQALTITAGMAGLVGLLSGVVVRFSLASSSNNRFLSPLQTFPTLSDWSSAPAERTAEADPPPSDSIDTEGDSVQDSWQAPSDLDWETDSSDFETFSSEGFTDTQTTTELPLENAAEAESRLIEKERLLVPVSSAAPSNFDAFANRSDGSKRSVEDPLKTLSNGPLLRTPALENELYDADAQSVDSSDNLSEGSRADGSRYDSIDWQIESTSQQMEFSGLDDSDAD